MRGVFARWYACFKIGRIVATGSRDHSIKVLEVERVLPRCHDFRVERFQKVRPDDPTMNHPVVRTLYDHEAPVTALAFHPLEPLLVSGGDDSQIYFFDLGRTAAKKAVRNITEVLPVRSISMHPSGDHMLVAVDHPVVRLYDTNTLACFVSASIGGQHTARVNSVAFDGFGRTYATSSDDGTIKVCACLSDLGRCFFEMCKHFH